MIDQPLTDLVFGAGYPKDNRWKLNDEVIEIESIRAPAHLPLLPDNLRNLRRVKIFELDSQFVLGLLDALVAVNRTKGNLLQLEIDLMRLPEGTAITYAFAALQMLSIDRMQVDDPRTVERHSAELSVVFDAPALRAVCLGKLICRSFSVLPLRTVC